MTNAFGNCEGKVDSKNGSKKGGRGHHHEITYASNSCITRVDGRGFFTKTLGTARKSVMETEPRGSILLIAFG